MLKKSSYYFSVFVFILFFVAACASPPPLKPLSKTDTILAFGDSLTYGMGTSQQNSYPAVLAQLSGLNVVNGGVSGDTTKDALNRLPALLQKVHPRLVIICLGANDMFRKVHKEQIKQNLKTMIILSQQSGAEVVLIGVPEPTILMDVPDFYQELAEEFNIPLENEAIPNLEKKPAYKSDSIHLNQQGYHILAEKILQLLRKTGALN